MKQLMMEWQGQKVQAWYHRVGDQVWVHLQGETYVYEPESTSRRKRGGSSTATGPDIVAPMPGKVTKISVEPGAPIAVGQVLVVMEAMKMEYTLKAKVAGQVSEVCTQVGEQVALGTVLVRVQGE